MKPVAAMSLIAVTACPVLAQQDEELASKVAKLEAQLKELQSNKSLNLEFGGRVQLDFNHFSGAYSADNEGNAASDFFPRRIRTYVESDQGDWEHKLLLDFAEGGAEIVTVRVRYTGWNNGPRFQFGKLREDITLNALTSSKHINTIERSSIADTFSPYFRWGASAYQYFKDSGFRYALGVYKNDAFGASGRDQDDRLALAYSGRLTWSQHTPGKTLHLGGWGSYRDMGGATLGNRLARGEVREAKVRLVDYAAGGDVVALDSMSQAGLELAYQHNAFMLEAEYATRNLDTLDPTSALDGGDISGYHLSLSYFLTGEHKQYSAGSAVFKQPKGVKNAWELVARISSMDAENAKQGTQVDAYTLGGTYYHSSSLKFMANLVYADVSGAGSTALVGDEDSGFGFAARLQYLF